MKQLLAAALLMAAALGSFPQARQSSPSMGPVPPETPEETSLRSEDAEERLQLAISSLDYPVTPGDIYQLSYRESAGSFVTRRFQVDSNSILDLGVFGKIYAQNMLFNELKANIEELISGNYMYSTPSLSIISPGIFRVAVRDESSQIQYVTAWGLSRISDVVAMAKIPNASIRNIERISRDGESARYDLLKAEQASPEGRDYLVRPGDTLALSRALRTVELRGEVWRPGRFELVGEEGVKELLTAFGGGFTRKADLEQLKIIHYSNSGERVTYLPFHENYESMPRLEDGDILVVGDRTAIRSLIWFEGAVAAPSQGGESSATEGADRAGAVQRGVENGRFYHYISEGVKLSDVLAEVSPSILPSADLGAALITVPGSAKPTVLDIRPLLSRSNLSSDIVLTQNTRIFIPEYRSRVSVAGAVIVPGFVPYLPGAPASYYVSLCGGFDHERNWLGALAVYDQFGHRRGAKQAIMPGDSIYVDSNRPGYNLQRSLPVLASILTALITAATFAVASGLVDLNL